MKKSSKFPLLLVKRRSQTEEVAASSSEQMDSMQEISSSAEGLKSEAQALQVLARKFKLA